MLTRESAGAELGGVHTVIVDEWHELIASKRGVQVQLALARLRQWSPGLVVDEIERSGPTLVFTNTRSQAEFWYQLLLAAKPEWAGLVALHHGSLDKATREWVELALKDGRLRAVRCPAHGADGGAPGRPRPGVAARAFARHKQSPGLFVSGLTPARAGAAMGAHLGHEAAHPAAPAAGIIAARVWQVRVDPSTERSQSDSPTRIGPR